MSIRGKAFWVFFQIIYSKWITTLALTTSSTVEPGINSYTRNETSSAIVPTSSPQPSTRITALPSTCSGMVNLARFHSVKIYCEFIHMFVFESFNFFFLNFHCNHVITLLYYLAHCKQLGFSSLPDDLTRKLKKNQLKIPMLKQHYGLKMEINPHLIG